MFRRLSEPLPLSEASLLLLRPALNTPVLNVGYLPIGPARAAVVAFAEEYGGIGIALGVRASESGQIAVLRNQESIDFDVPLADALEPLLAEAERMGFLFDEDVLEEEAGQKGRSRAMTFWADLMGGMESMLPHRSPEPDSSIDPEDDGSVGPLSPSMAVAEAQYLELILDDVAPLELDDDEDVVVHRLVADATETLDPDLELDLDDSLEHGLDEALDGALDDDEDWTLEDDALLGESDLTEPTAPIAPPSAASETHSRLAAMRAALPPPGPATPPPAAPRLASSAAIPSSLPAEPVVAATPVPRVPRSTGDPTPGPGSAPSPAAARIPAAAPTGSAGTGPAPAPLGADKPAVRDVSKARPRRHRVPTKPSPAVAPTPPRVVLSKFRNPEGLRSRARTTDSSEVGADRSSELARIPIVRVRRDRDPGKRVPFLARLLSSF